MITSTSLFLVLKQTILIVFSKKRDLSWFLGVGIASGLLGFFANAAFIDVFEASKVAITFWLLAGILIGLARLRLLPEKRK